MNGKHQSPDIQVTNGITPITEQAEKVEIMAKHYESILDTKREVPREHELSQLISEKKLQPSGGFSLPFSERELLTASKKLKSNKAAGHDNIPKEFLKQIQPSSHLFSAFLTIFNQSWGEGFFPSTWKKDMILPTIKEGKDKT